DTDSRLKNARVMEQRLIDILKTKTGKVSDLLQVEKELGRVREDIEKMQGALKYMDAIVQFATVTISLAEKDLEEPAAFLLKERAQLALYAPEVEKVYNDIKALASPKTQIKNSRLDRETKRPGPQFIVQPRPRWPRVRQCVAACANEKLQRAHAIAELARESRERERAAAGPYRRADR